MGLPLFIPRVESDLPAKSPAKTDPAHARSPIRRSDRSSDGSRRHNAPEQRRRLIEAREQRLRMLAAIRPDDDDALPPLTASAALVAGAAAPAPLSRSQQLAIQHERTRDSLRRERLTSLSRLAQTQAQNSAYERFNIELDLINGAPSHMLPPIREPTQPPASSRRHTQPHRSPRVERTVSPHPRFSPITTGGSSNRRQPRETQQSPPHFATLEDVLRTRAPETMSPRSRSSRHHRHFDGLGDRDRSLSPEGDGVWDTLQSTLTPDPQPPSVGSSFAGSSFASTIANTVSHSSTANSSANTSITLPVDPCDPVDDNSENDEMTDFSSLGGVLVRRRRTYADILAGDRSRQSPEADPNLNAGDQWLNGLHHIVRRLASRDDIPDEWWAQAGLSRSMSWEDAN